MKFRIAHILVAMAILAVALFLLHSSQVAVYDGKYLVTVEIDAGLAAQSKSIAYAPASNLHMASDVVAAALADNFGEMKHSDSLGPFDLSVRHSHRVSLLRGRVGDFQEYSYIVLVLFRVDGLKEVHRLAVPHHDNACSIVVNNDSLVSISGTGV